MTVIPLGRALLRGSSDLPGGCDAPSRHVLPGEAFTPTGSLPIWSCSVWGLPCPLHYCNGGALLPHLFTLTPRIRRCTRRYVFCGTSRQPGLNPASRTLSGTLLCGVRTFLPRRPKAPRATVRSSCLRDHYMRCASVNLQGDSLNAKILVRANVKTEHGFLLLLSVRAIARDPADSFILTNLPVRRELQAHVRTAD